MEKTEENKQNTSLIEGMFKAGAHFGYSRTRRHPSFKPILFGMKNTVDIIDLEKTGSYLNQACEFVKKIAQEGKTVLFVGTKPETKKAMEEIVKLLGVSYVSYRWVGGTITNFQEIKKRVDRLAELEKKKEGGELDVYTKKERLDFDTEIEKLTKKFGGIIGLKHAPHVLVVVDPRHEHTAVNEAIGKKIPIVALAGTDCDISNINYPIPANDSSTASIYFFMEKIAEAYKTGKQEAEKEKKNEEVKKEEPKTEQSLS